MSFLNLKKSEDRWISGIFLFGVVLIAIGHGLRYGWWALLTVPAYLIVIFIIVGTIRWLIERARRKDLRRKIEAEVNRALEEAGLEPIEVTNRPPAKRTWASLWSPRRDR